MLESSCNPDVVQVQSGWSLELPRVQRGYVLPYPTCLLVQYTLLYTCASHIRPPYRFQGAPVQTLKVCSYVLYIVRVSNKICRSKAHLTKTNSYPTEVQIGRPHWFGFAKRFGDR